MSWGLGRDFNDIEQQSGDDGQSNVKEEASVGLETENTGGHTEERSDEAMKVRKSL